MKQKFIIYCVILAFLSLLTLSAFWSANDFFSSAYRTVIEQAARRHDAMQKAHDVETSSSVEPQAIGLRENEIKKEYGHGYSTY